MDPQIKYTTQHQSAMECTSRVELNALRARHRRVIVKILQQNMDAVRNFISHMETSAVSTKSEADKAATGALEAVERRLLEDTEVEVNKDKRDEFNAWLVGVVSNEILCNTLRSEGTKAVSEIAKEIGFVGDFQITPVMQDDKYMEELQEMLMVKEEDTTSDESGESDESDEEEGGEEENSEDDSQASKESEESGESEDDAEALEEEAAKAGIKGKKLKRLRDEITEAGV